MAITDIHEIRFRPAKITTHLLRICVNEASTVACIKYSYTFVDAEGNEITQGTVDVGEDLTLAQKKYLWNLLDELKGKAEATYNQHTKTPK